MFASLIAKFGLGLLWGRVKTSTANGWNALPPKVKLGLAALVVAIVLFIGHQWYAKRQLKASYNAGYAKAIADVTAAEAKKVAPLKDAKIEGDARVAAKVEGVRKNVDHQDAHIDSNVDALMRVYAAPTGGVRRDAGSGVPGGNATAGAGPANARANDGLADANSEPTITVPAKQLITRAGICDRDYVALKGWEQTYTAYLTEYNAWLAKTRKITH
jgi:hypothetical protein